MKSSLFTVAALSLALATACSDRGDNTSQNPPANDPNAPAATAPADSTRPSEGQGEPAARTDATSEGARPTTGSAPRSAPASRPAQPRANSTAEGRTSTQPNAAAPEGTSARSSAAASRESASAPRTPEFREVTIPAGTALPLELETDLSSETAQVETPVRARLKQALSVNGVAAIPAGAILVGEVTDVERAGKVKGRSRLAFTFNRLEANNVREDVRTNPLTFQGEASKGEDATKVGAGAVGGAIVGGILGGGEGAAKGAAIGGAAGTGVVLATRGKDVKLTSGTDLAASLAAPLTIRVPLR